MGDRLGLVVAPGVNVPTAAIESAPALRDPDPLKGGDVYQWAMDQSVLIRAGRFDEVDWINVADEIESVGKSEIRALVSNLEIVLTHMLKWDHQPARRGRSWVKSINVHRVHIEQDLDDSGSLRAKVKGLADRGVQGCSRGCFGGDEFAARSVSRRMPLRLGRIMTRSFVLDQTNADPTDAAS